MSERIRLALKALRQALSIRRSHGYSLNRPVPIYDLVEKLGIDLWFMDVPSMEGVYHSSAPARIIVSAARPSGRRAFTCAHELGHYVFGHGTRLDDLTDQHLVIGTDQPEEYLADSFASALMMPKAAVDWAFRIRGWNPEAPTPAQVYTVARWLGVGYETLAHHMGLSLGMVSQSHMNSLLHSSPKQIRADLLGFAHAGDLLVADQYWQDRTLDIEVGDLVKVAALSNIEGECIERFSDDSGTMAIRGATPGRGRVISVDGRWSAYVRVSRRNYVGRGIFRHLEDPVDG